jgi:hypothetical protein
LRLQRDGFLVHFLEDRQEDVRNVQEAGDSS